LRRDLRKRSSGSMKSATCGAGLSDRNRVGARSRHQGALCGGAAVSHTIGRRAFEDGLICYPCAGHVGGVLGDTIIVAPPYNAREAELAELIGKLTAPSSARWPQGELPRVGNSCECGPGEGASREPSIPNLPGPEH